MSRRAAAASPVEATEPWFIRHGLPYFVPSERAAALYAVTALPVADNLSVELVQVSIFLAAFSGLYFTVTVLTDDTYRRPVLHWCDGRARPGGRRPAAYLALRP